MSSTWKSLGVGFLSGVLSTGLFALGLHVVGALLWGASLLYIGYNFYESKKGS